MTEIGYLRVVSFRRGSEAGPESGETVIDMDRSHPCLGNRHWLRDPNDSAARRQVIAKNELDLERDFLSEGQKYLAIALLAKRVADGERICGRCWCSPLPCHVDGIARRVNAMALAYRDGTDPRESWRRATPP